MTVTVPLPSSAGVSGWTVTTFDPEIAKARLGSLIDNVRDRQSRRERRGDLCRRHEYGLHKPVVPVKRQRIVHRVREGTRARRAVTGGHAARLSLATRRRCRVGL